MLISSISFAQVTLSWFNFPGGVAVARDAANNVYTANWDYNPGGDITLSKRNEAGNIIWEVPYDNTDATRHEVATWVASDNAGNILVSGTIRSGYSNPVNAASVLMKFNPSGTLLWRTVYESSFDGSSTRKCLVDANNNIYVIGIGTGPNGQVTKVKKFNASGATVWNYFDNGGGAPLNIKFTPDNHLLLIKRGITGSINSFSKIDLNGNLIWNTAGINSLPAGDAAGDAFGNTYIINGETIAVGGRSALKKLSASGTLIWAQSLTFNGNKVEVGTDNNPVVSGYPQAGFGAAFTKYDLNGTFLWQNLDADGASVALLSHAELRLDASNAAYLAGSTMSQMGICKVNSDGSTGWTGLTSSGYPTNFVFGTDNSIFVTGGTTARFVQGTVQPIATPTNLTATANGTSINLTWTDNASNETSYVVQQSQVANSGFVTIATLPANSVAYTQTNLAYATTIYYRVQAANATSTSGWSNTANATTIAAPPPTTPAAPSNLVATSGGCNQMNLKWKDNASNETSFEISRANSLNGTYVLIATVSANTIAYTNTGLRRNRVYYYRVRARNAVGSSTWSNRANAIVMCNTGFTDLSRTSISLYPNPVADMLYINGAENNKGTLLVEIYDLSGNRLRSQQISGNNLNISTLKTGTYRIRVVQNSELVYSGNFIKIR